MARLEEGYDSGGRRYFLDGQPVECGRLLEVSLEAGWLGVRFGMDSQQYALFYLRLGSGQKDQFALRLPDTAELRWPLEEEHPQETQLRKLRRVVEELADMVKSPVDYYDYERASAVHHAQSVLRATAPRIPEEHTY